jgi:hypothetical protein
MQTQSHIVRSTTLAGVEGAASVLEDIRGGILDVGVRGIVGSAKGVVAGDVGLLVLAL